MDRCQCKNKNGSNCKLKASRIEGDDERFCWRHQNCESNDSTLVELNCLEKYNDFVNTGDLKSLKECYSNELDDFRVENEPNPLKENETCKLATKRREKYYVHEYKPQKTIHKLEKLGKEGHEYLSHVLKIFDFTEKKNCCNCVVLSLYAVKFQDLVDKYLPSIVKTIKNVAQSLPDWLVRIYMDSSVFETLQKYRTESESEEKLLNEEFVENSLDFFFTSENVEIYTYFCNSVLNKEINIGRTRMLRFLPMIDESVSCCAIREADGIVSNLDCHNLRVFSGSDKIFYVVPYSRPEGKFTRNEKRFPDESYNDSSIWLRYYKKFIETQFFKKKNNTFFLLAGVISLNLKVKKGYFDNILNDTSNKVSQFILDYEKYIKPPGKNDDEGFLKTFNFDEKTRIFFHKKNLKKYEMGKKAMQVGFDEILLMALFKDLISTDFKLSSGRIDSFDEKQEKIINAMVDHFEIKIFKIGDEYDDQYEESVKELVENNILQKKSIYEIEKLTEPSENLREIFQKNFLMEKSLKNKYFAITFLDFFMTPEFFTKSFLEENIMCDFEIGKTSILELLQVTYRDYYYLTDGEDPLFAPLIELDT